MNSVFNGITMYFINGMKWNTC